MHEHFPETNKSNLTCHFLSDLTRLPLLEAALVSSPVSDAVRNNVKNFLVSLELYVHETKARS